MEKSKITIGLCIRNCEKTVEAAVRSVLLQDFPRYLVEFIVVDGRSTDNTLWVVKRILAKEPVHVIYFCDEGKGLGTARWLVVEHATGKYVLWVDGDIILPKDYLREQWDFMEQHPGVGIVRGRWKSYDGKNLVASLESMRLLEYDVSDVRTKSTPHLPGIAGSLYRLEALRQVGNFDRQIRGAGEDTDIAARIRVVGWTISINYELTHDFRKTWSELWSEYFWWGYGMHYVNHKLKGLVILWYKLPPVAFMVGFVRSISAYRITRRKIAFLLPFQRAFKESAWWSGFITGHIDRYGHFQRQ